jgi:hypothetical protein
MQLYETFRDMIVTGLIGGVIIFVGIAVYIFVDTCKKIEEENQKKGKRK